MLTIAIIAPHLKKLAPYCKYYFEIYYFHFIHNDHFSTIKYSSIRTF